MKDNKMRLDWKHLAITTAIVLLTAGITFFATWYILDKSMNEQNEASDKLRIELQRQISILNNKSATATNTTPTPTPAATNDITTNWPTYTNQMNGYSIKYPNGWVYLYDGLDSTDSKPIFRKFASDQWQLQIETATTSNSLQQSVDTEKASKVKSGYTVTTSNVTVGSKSAIKLSFSGKDGIYGDTETLLINNGKLYIISQGLGSDTDESNMVKTFKLL